MASQFQDKNIIVAGGTSGIGFETARLLASAGALVTATGRSPERLKAAEQAGLKTAQLNSMERSALDTFFQAYGKVDHLVICLSGKKGIGSFNSLSLPVLRQGFEEKFFAQLDTLQASLPYMHEGGSITLVTAISASAKSPGTSGLAAINGALEIMVPILAKELKPLRINAVSPGVVDTAWWDFLPSETKQETFSRYAAEIPAGRVAQPLDIAKVILFLADNDYMTGKVIACDGGLA